jgi:hypothetical protein
VGKRRWQLVSAFHSVLQPHHRPVSPDAQATIIQRLVRGFVVRRWYARKHAKEHAAATRMQLMFRRWRALKVGAAAARSWVACTGIPGDNANVARELRAESIGSSSHSVTLA